PAASTTPGRSTSPTKPVKSPSPPGLGGESPSVAPSGDSRGSPATPGGPVRRTGPASVPTTPPPAPAPGTDITSFGGVVRVHCSDGKASVVSVRLNPGYVIKESRPGPADEIRVVLRSP